MWQDKEGPLGSPGELCGDSDTHGTIKEAQWEVARRSWFKRAKIGLECTVAGGVGAN